MDQGFPNLRLAEHLEQISYYYKITNDTYRHKAFLEASKNIEIYPYLITSGLDAKNKIGKGIGSSIIEVIDEFLLTGTSSRLDHLRSTIPQPREAIIKLFTSIYGIGPVKANNFYEEGFRTLEDLWNRGNLTDAQKLGIYYLEHLKLRISRREIDIVNNFFHKVFPNLEFVIVGSYRREEPDSGDIDILIKHSPGVNLSSIVDVLKGYNLILGDLALGEHKYLGLFQLNETLPVRRLDLFIIQPDSWGSALLYSTGSKNFNILMRRRAIELGYQLNEFGLYNQVGQKIPTATEGDIFNILRVKYILPVERKRDINRLELIN